MPLMAGGVNADSQNQTMSTPMNQTSSTVNTTATNTDRSSNNSNSNNSNNNSSSSNNSITGNSSNSSQLNAIKTQIQNQYSSLQAIAQPYRQKYQKLPKNDKSQQNALESQFEKQAKPVQKKIAALQKKYVNTMTPKQRKQMKDQQKAQKANQKKMMQQIQKINKAQEKKQKDQMLKTAQTVFLVNTKNHKVYTTKADITTKKGAKASSATPVPGTTKKYMSLKKFNLLDRKELLRARFMYVKASRIRNKTVRIRRIMQADKLFKKFNMVLSMTPQKSRSKKNNTNTHNRKKRVITHKRGKRISRLSYRMSKSTKRSRTRRVHRNKSRSFTVKEGKTHVTYLRSMYRHSNRKNARKSGFARGRVLSGNVHTMFNRYLPNSRRAVIPHGYRIYRVNINRKTNQPATVWLVGRHTNNVNKINHMRQAYYYRYSKQYGGWVNVGFGHN